MLLEEMKKCGEVKCFRIFAGPFGAFYQVKPSLWALPLRHNTAVHQQYVETWIGDVFILIEATLNK